LGRRGLGPGASRKKWSATFPRRLWKRPDCAFPLTFPDLTVNPVMREEYRPSATV